MNKMMYKEINANRCLYQTLTITNFNSKSMRFLFKSSKNKEGLVGGLTHPTPPVTHRIDRLDKLNQYELMNSKN